MKPLLLTELVPGPWRVQGPRHTMGLCVHPALPWSRAGRASSWGEAKNSCPRRGPPLPLPDSTAPCLPPPGERGGREEGKLEQALWQHLLAGHSWVLAPAGLFPSKAFWVHYITRGCSLGRGQMEGEGAREVWLYLSLPKTQGLPPLSPAGQGPETPRLGDCWVCTRPWGFPNGSWPTPWGSESPAGGGGRRVGWREQVRPVFCLPPCPSCLESPQAEKLFGC